MLVSVVCRNWPKDRVLPRFARYLRAIPGWSVTATPVVADATYLMGYFEVQVCKPWPSSPVASLFTHREEEPPNGDKARLYDQIAQRVGLRVAMCRKYGEGLEAIGPTIQPPLPVERSRFVPVKRPEHAVPVVGLAGYTYGNHRKGEDLAAQLVTEMGARCAWSRSGRGWAGHAQTPLPWSAMPSYYQGLDVLVCPSRVEGGPMPVLEALSCGVRVVVPSGVGIVDELPDVRGIHRYERGSVEGMSAALGDAIAGEPSPEELRASVERHSVEAWCAAHREGFERWLS